MADLDDERAMLSGITENEYLTWNLARAQMHAQQALDELYKPEGTRRGYFYRSALGRAQSTLMTLLRRELDRGRKR